VSAKTGGLHAALQGRYGVPGDALFAFIASTIAVAVTGLAAFLFKQPLLFPSIGPAAAFSVGVTTGILILLRANHPPAAATTLLVSLGLLATTHDVLMILVGVVLVTVTSWLLNRAAGLPVPVWEGNTDTE
jgi:hypothetical protein